MIQEDKAFLVSIVIPVYDVSAYIERCIFSVINQTYEHIECIIVDDATPDDSIIKCEQLIANYEGSIRFVILHHDRNRGLSASRNTGIDAATGEYVFFLDSDDELEPDCIEKMIGPVQNDKNIEMVLGNHEMYVYRFPKAPVKKGQTHFPEGDYDSLKKVRNLFKNGGYGGHAWNKLVKKDFLVHNQLFFKEGVLWEDILWSFFVIKRLNHLYIIPDVTLKYFIRPHSILTGTSFQNKAYHFEKVYAEIAANFTEGEEGWEAKKLLRGFCSNFINNYDSPTSKHTAQLFLNALSGRLNTLARVYLKFVIFLSKFALGRAVFAIARSVRKVIKGEKVIVSQINHTTVS